MGVIRPIETQYKGYRFRSRLEARWAVFFDAMRIEWQYEPQGFELDLGDWYENPPARVTRRGVHPYLPDFWLPQVKMYAEVKPSWFEPDELALSVHLAETTGHPCLLLDGVPADRMYWAAHDMDFEHGGWNLNVWEYDLTDGHFYWLAEGRFFLQDGMVITDWDQEPYHTPSDGSPCRGVAAARAARFEFGETPR